MATAAKGGDGGGLLAAAELKPLLHLAKRQPLSCAVAMSKDKTGLLVLHRRTRPRKLLAELKSQAKARGIEVDTTSLRFGRVAVDGSSDAGMATFTVNKPAPGPMKRALLEQVRPAGLQRCEIVVDAALEDEAEEGDDEAAGDGGGVPPGRGTAAVDAGGRPSATPGAGPPTPGTPPAPPAPPVDGTADGQVTTGGEDWRAPIRRDLTGLAHQIASGTGRGTPHRQQLLALANDANAAIKAGDHAGAAEGVSALQTALGASSGGSGISAGVAPAPPGADEPQAPSRNPDRPGTAPASPGNPAQAGAPAPSNTNASAQGTTAPDAVAPSAPPSAVMPAGGAPGGPALRDEDSALAADITLLNPASPPAQVAGLRQRVEARFGQPSPQARHIDPIISALVQSPPIDERRRAATVRSLNAWLPTAAPDEANPDEIKGRLAEAVGKAIPLVLGAGGEKLKELASPQSAKILTAVTATFITAQLCPVAWAADVFLVIALGASAYMMGSEVKAVIGHLRRFSSLVRSRDGSLDEAARHLADAVAAVGIDMLLGLLLHKAGTEVKRMPPMDGPPPGMAPALAGGGRMPAAALAGAPPRGGLMAATGPGRPGMPPVMMSTDGQGADSGTPPSAGGGRAGEPAGGEPGPAGRGKGGDAAPADAPPSALPGRGTQELQPPPAQPGGTSAPTAGAASPDAQLPAAEPVLAQPEPGQWSPGRAARRRMTPEQKAEASRANRERRQEEQQRRRAATDTAWAGGKAADPMHFANRSVEDIQREFAERGFTATVSQGELGSGLTRVLDIGSGPINQIKVHPGGGEHVGAYTVVSGGGGTVRIIDPKTYYRTSRSTGDDIFLDSRTGARIDPDTLPVRLRGGDPNPQEGRPGAAGDVP